MKKFLVLYSGGKAPTSQQEAEASMKVWMAWFGKLGAAVVDAGNPLGESKTIGITGIHDGPGGNSSNGWGFIQADSLASAAALTKDCPIIAEGGKVHVFDLIAM
jgi:hypothetical protein